MAERLLEVNDLSTHFFTHAGVVKAVNGVSFTLDRKETLGIVGESGSGKTVAALSLMRLVPDPPGKIVEGSLMLGDRDLRTLSDDEMRAGARQRHRHDLPGPHDQPQPRRQGRQADRRGDHAAPGQAQERGAGTWPPSCSTGSASPTRASACDQYPFEFSGGMRQRAMIAMAISCNPDILIADEPTTALDVTIQAQIIDVVREMQAQYESGVILITHDLGVVAEIADKVMVMYGGRTVEYGSVDEIFYNPHHPYTWGLLARCRGSTSPRRRGSRPSRGSRRTSSRCPPAARSPGAAPTSGPSAATTGPSSRLVGPEHGVHCWIPIDERTRSAPSCRTSRTSAA